MFLWALKELGGAHCGGASLPSPLVQMPLFQEHSERRRQEEGFTSSLGTPWLRQVDTQWTSQGGPGSRRSRSAGLAPPEPRETVCSRPRPCFWWLAGLPGHFWACGASPQRPAPSFLVVHPWCTCLCHISSSHEDTCPTGLGPTLPWYHLVCNSLVSKRVCFLSYQRLEMKL